MELYGLFAHTGFHGVHLYILIFYRSFSCFQCFQTVKPCPLLGTSGPAASRRPFQFHPKDTAAFTVAGKLHLFSLGLQLQKFGVISCVGI